MAFVEEVDQASPLVHLTTFGYSYEGRPLPLAVVGRVKDGSAEAVRATGLTRVYLQANIHAGEVEGKEVLQMLLRDLALGRTPEWTRIDGAAHRARSTTRTATSASGSISAACRTARSAASVSARTRRISTSIAIT